MYRLPRDNKKINKNWFGAGYYSYPKGGGSLFDILKKGFQLIKPIAQPLIAKGIDTIQNKLSNKIPIMSNLINTGREAIRSKTGYGMKRTKLKLNL